MSEELLAVRDKKKRCHELAQEYFKKVPIDNSSMDLQFVAEWNRDRAKYIADMLYDNCVVRELPQPDEMLGIELTEKELKALEVLVTRLVDEAVKTTITNADKVTDEEKAEMKTFLQQDMMATCKHFGISAVVILFGILKDPE